MIAHLATVGLRPVDPILATLVRDLARLDGWTSAVKWDGYRTLVLKNDSRVQLLSRNLKDITKPYASITRGDARSPADTALVDGQMVALDADGRRLFHPRVPRRWVP